MFKIRRLEGKVAVITGAGSGIGKATALLFAQEGAKVVVVDLVDELGKETVEIIRGGEGKATFLHADVSKALDAENIVGKTVEKYGRIDVLFNNAGVRASELMLEEMSEEEWDRIISINLKGVFLVSKYTVPIMKKQGGGVIVNTASTYSFVGRARGTAYCASKGGVHQFTKAAALELSPYNIRVNCVCPGTTINVTPNGPILYGRPVKPEWVEDRVKDFPIGRLCRPEDIASAVLYLASDESSFVTGSALLVDGGYTTK